MARRRGPHLTDVTRKSLGVTLAEPWEALTIVEPSMTPPSSGTARGRLAGGNLALVAALAGTPYAPDLDGTILMLEDVNEAVYRIDRMLTQLWLSGAVARHAGLAFGSFTDIPPPPSEDSPAAIARSNACWRIRQRCGVPCVSGFHGPHRRPEHIPTRRHGDMNVDRKGPDDRALEFTDNQPSDSMKTGEQLMAEAKARIKEVTPQEASTDSGVAIRSRFSTCATSTK
jgi:hypothetical protein